MVPLPAVVFAILVPVCMCVHAALNAVHNIIVICTICWCSLLQLLLLFSWSEIDLHAYQG